MSAPGSWWQQEARYFLNETLAFINSSRSRVDSIGRCEELCKALNKTWNAFFQYRRDAGKLNDKEKENEAKRATVGQSIVSSVDASRLERSAIIGILRTRQRAMLR
jgi:hypothetical protein